MAFIRTIASRDATGELAKAYEMHWRLTGARRAANVMKVFSLAPRVMQRVLRRWELSMWTGPEPRVDRELVASAVSRTLSCSY